MSKYHSAPFVPKNPTKYVGSFIVEYHDRM